MAKTINHCNTIGSLKDYIKQLDFSYDKMFLKSLVSSNENELIVNSSSLDNRYFYYITSNTYTLSLSNSEYMKYRYQPKLFCNDVYGTPELWALLLKINNFTSITEFNTKTIKVFNSKIFNILNEILVAERETILENQEAIGY